MLFFRTQEQTSRAADLNDLDDLVKLMIWDEQNIIRAGTTEPGTHHAEETVVKDCGSGYISTPRSS